MDLRSGLRVAGIWGAAGVAVGLLFAAVGSLLDEEVRNGDPATPFIFLLAAILFGVFAALLGAGCWILWHLVGLLLRRLPRPPSMRAPSQLTAAGDWWDRRLPAGMPKTRRRVVRGIIIGAILGYILWFIAFGVTAFAFRDAPDPPSNAETLRLVAIASLVYGAFGGAFYGGLIGAVAGFVGDLRAGRGGAA